MVNPRKQETVKYNKGDFMDDSIVKVFKDFKNLTSDSVSAALLTLAQVIQFQLGRR